MNIPFDIRVQIESMFPNLKTQPYSITSPNDKKYNCIAWVLNDNQNHWWPQQYSAWPDDIPRQNSIDSFIKLFEKEGYKETKNSAYQSGYQKIALYVGEDGLPKHATKQLNNGLWTSKLGQAVDIKHTLDGLEGPKPSYGKVSLIFQKRL